MQFLIVLQHLLKNIVKITVIADTFIDDKVPFLQMVVVICHQTPISVVSEYPRVFCLCLKSALHLQIKLDAVFPSEHVTTTCISSLSDHLLPGHDHCLN